MNQVTQRSQPFQIRQRHTCVATWDNVPSSSFGTLQHLTKPYETLRDFTKPLVTKVTERIICHMHVFHVREVVCQH